MTTSFPEEVGLEEVAPLPQWVPQPVSCRMGLLPPWPDGDGPTPCGGHEKKPSASPRARGKGKGHSGPTGRDRRHPEPRASLVIRETSVPRLTAGKRREGATQQGTRASAKTEASPPTQRLLKGGNLVAASPHGPQHWINDTCKEDARKVLIKLDVLAIKVLRKYASSLCAAFCSRAAVPVTVNLAGKSLPAHPLCHRLDLKRNILRGGMCVQSLLACLPHSPGLTSCCQFAEGDGFLSKSQDCNGCQSAPQPPWALGAAPGRLYSRAPGSG